MPEYLSPGVYVEEVDTGSKPIEGVGTSTAAFVGIAEKGPLNKPLLITNFGDFVRTFGGFLKKSYLAYAVFGFFNNGGKRCFIVRVADEDAASKATVDFFNRSPGDPLINIEALNEGEWGNKITVNIEQASSGSTHLFLASLAENVPNGQEYIKLTTTVGLSIGSTIVITTDGINLETHLVVGLAPDGVVNFAAGDGVGDDYNKDNTRVYIKILQNFGKATVKSATGFSAGTIVVFQSADPTVNPVTVTLDDVNQPERRLSWTGLHPAIDGAAYVDVKGVKNQWNLITSPINATDNSVPKANFDPIDTADVGRLEVGDMVTFKNGINEETLTVQSTTVATITFEEDFKYSYGISSTKITAMTSSKTKLFHTLYKPVTFSRDTVNSTITFTLREKVIGLNVDDYITLIEHDDSAEEEVQILDVIISSNTVLTTTEPPGGPGTFENDDTKVHFTLKQNGTEIVVASPEGFSVNDFIQIVGGGDDKSFKIDNISNNRITFKGEPLWSTDVHEADIIAKKWVPTSVKSQEFCIKAVYGENEIVETFDKLSIDGTSPSYFARNGVINDISTLITVADARPSPGLPPGSPDDLPALVSKPLTGGNDGITNIEASDYIGTITATGERSGLNALEAEDEVNIIAIPDVMMSFGGGNGVVSPDDVELIQLAMISHCERLKDRFAVLDSIRRQTVQEVHSWRLDNLDSKYAAIYYPWIKVSDPIKAENGNTRFIPTSGHMAGIYARSDTERGVHKAPANEVPRGVIELERKITTGEHDILNPDGINCIRAFAGRGIRVWGARTISSDPDWKYINVRRLFIFVEESIEEGTQWVVFEPNDEPTWARIRRSVSNFLTNVWRDGALQGRTPEEAFFVRCDRTTMTQTDIDNGKLIMEIGIAPVKPAEFVIFRIGQWTGGSEVEEV